MRSWFRKTGKDSDPNFPTIEEHEDEAENENENENESEHEHGGQSLMDPNSFYRQTLYGDLQLFDAPPLPPATDAQDRLRPMQYPAPRIETLCISENERDLYLAALSSLEQPTPQLTLYADPAPALPTLPPTSTPLTLPHVPYPSTPVLNPRTHQKTPSTGKHAILTLVDDAGLRFTGFPPDAIISAYQAIKANWKFGVTARTGDPSKLKHLKEPIVYRVELKGKAWNRKGNQELESIRLLLAVFSALGQHGYNVAGSIASMGKNDTLNLLFRSVPSDDRPPAPLFFALTLPLPDRIALVSTPNAATEALIDAVRASIFEVASEIKLENWVHPGVYRFWIAGMRRLVGGVKSDTVAKLLPPLMVNIIDSLAALHFDYVTSIQLEPSAPGRDILLFASTPRSGLGFQDSFVPDECKVSVAPKAAVKVPVNDDSLFPALSHAPSYRAESPINAFFPPDLNPYNPANNIKFTQPQQAQPQSQLQTKPQPQSQTQPRPILQSSNATQWPQPNPSITAAPPAPAFGPPSAPPLRKRTSLDSEEPRRVTAGDFALRPPRHPARGVPSSPPAWAETNLISRFPDPPTRPMTDRRPSERWEQIVRNSTPGRYPSHLPDEAPLPVTSPLKVGVRVGFPSTKRALPTPPAPPPKWTDAKTNVTPYPAPLANIPAPASDKPPTKSPQPPLHTRASVDSQKSTGTMQSCYSSTEDHLVTPNLTSSTLNFNFNKEYPIDRSRKLSLSRAPGPVSLPPPPRRPSQRERERESSTGTGDTRASKDGKRESRKSQSQTPRPPSPKPQTQTQTKPKTPPATNNERRNLPQPPTRAPPLKQLASYPSSDLEPAALTPRAQPKVAMEDLRNVRLSTAFDDARNVRLSMGSEFSISTASSRPPGVGSSRARMSLSRAQKERS